MARYREEGLTIHKVRATSERHSPQTLLTTSDTLPRTTRQCLPSGENCAWNLQKKTGLRFRSFHVQRSIGCTWDTSFWEQDGSASHSPLKGKSRHMQSGELSLRASSNDAFAKHSKRQANPYYHTKTSDFHSATTRGHYVVIPSRPSTVLTVPRHRQLDGATESGEQDGECSTVLPQHCCVSEATDNSQEPLGQIGLPTPPPSPPPDQLLDAADPYLVSLSAPGDSIFSSPSGLPLSNKALDKPEKSPNGRLRFSHLGCKDNSPSPSSFHLSNASLRLGQHSPTSKSRSGSVTPSQSRDRFILPRRSPVHTRDSFQLSTSPAKLSSKEKVTRNRYHGPDPFAHRPRSSTAGAILSNRSHLARETRSDTIRPSSPNSPLSATRLSLANGVRQISSGAIWAVGGAAAPTDSAVAVADGHRGFFTSGSTAPLYRTNFLDRLDSTMESEAYERRLALALDVDTSSRVLAINDTTTSSNSANHSPDCTQIPGPTIWKDGQWIKEGSTTTSKKILRNKRVISTVPFRVLDAPSLRDDYYCSPLAYSATAKYLAVGLGSHVCLWSENGGADTLEYLNAPYLAHVTSLSFSSTEGGKGILAIGRACGRLLLWSPFENDPRFISIHCRPVCCVSFRPNTVKRLSRRDRYLTVKTEELLVGDQAGHVYFYSVEWPTLDQYGLFGFPGALTLLCRITVHNQQICRLAWSPDGDFFASGGNDNTCHLFETRCVLRHALADINNRNPQTPTTSAASSLRDVNITTSSPAFNLGHGAAKHQWTVLAAVKAIAFCPWQRGLIAIGGGSNDRCIHFYHTLSGSKLATIDCNAQVTSLIWSTTRREIAATFGFAQPQHPYRIAVFSWPKCEVVVRIPWFEGHRALFAIPYPRGPDIGQARGEGGEWWSRTQEEGCLVVAASDESINFHEVWAEKRKAMGSKGGLLGGSDILESMHGIEKEMTEVIR